MHICYFLRQSSLEIIDDVVEEEGTIQAECASLSSSHSDWKSMGNFLRVSLDNNQSTVIPLHSEMTVLEVVENTCGKRQLNPEGFYLKLGVEDSSGVTGKENIFSYNFCEKKLLASDTSIIITLSFFKFSKQMCFPLQLVQ